ncbi:MAG: SpoIID/LytB domain-containing protein [Bacteroidales bacterium]|jgi:SpoIID/LytB domain protein|nr:SpoIID/LytB domain-containing protein [Bacteroidales bacterium]
MERYPQCPAIQVGILSAVEADFTLHGIFTCRQTEENITGDRHLRCLNGQVADTLSGKNYVELSFVPQNDLCAVEIRKVTIGVDFHWERTETQIFSGALRIIADGERLCIINVIDAERYLQSVISSEMSATAMPEFLKTHAIISRSWVLVQIARRGKREQAFLPHRHTHTETEQIRWFDHEDHDLFDVCADDHCQRYQGTTRIVSPSVKEAVNATRGMALTYNGGICDARFSKCCGGVTETFENVWEPVRHPYLASVTDAEQPLSPNLSDEAQAKEWILSTPPSFCNISDKKITEQALNCYDLETPDFFRWRTEYGHEELSQLIAARSGIDFGGIIQLIPLQRGASGRIVRLLIEGTRRSMTVGKELLIRRWLSPSHLYSSAFVVEKTDTTFILHGAGWGHGVGLCQIGAAAMCAKGYSCRQILSHYYPGSSIETMYR